MLWTDTLSPWKLKKGLESLTQLGYNPTYRLSHQLDHSLFAVCTSACLATLLLWSRQLPALLSQGICHSHLSNDIMGFSIINSQSLHPSRQGKMTMRFFLVPLVIVSFECLASKHHTNHYGMHTHALLFFNESIFIHKKIAISSINILVNVHALYY